MLVKTIGKPNIKFTEMFQEAVVHKMYKVS